MPFTDVFLAEEWRHVVLARRIGTAAAYLSAKRTGRVGRWARGSGPKCGRRCGSSSRR
ncbi:uvrD/REP helicase domain protein [Mycobacterium kansasii]|uniref:UvrD/REP helicase domain protein n=1 Tax=Mycobacterium kansasii TaxID=1768 RepID=A0A1V3WHR6_MYCKA|nr:uvrD/REP helicase domain protein [Mycobacterium kansasii]